MTYRDKKDQAACAKRHYERNKEIIKERVTEFKKVAKARNKEILRKYLAEHPCVDCGENDLIVLDFDHVTGKKRGAVTTLARKPVGVETLLKEIAKCEVRCANCHRRKTARELNSLLTG